MNRSLIIGIIAAVGVGAGAYYMSGGADAPAQQTSAAPAGGGFAGGGFAGGGFAAGGRGGGARPPMTVEVGSVTRADMSQRITVVGNLIGAATVAAVPKISGRLETIGVRLGDRVTAGQRLAQIDDREIREQVKQAEASFQVSAATIRQREADLRFAQTNLERSRNLFERQLIPRQTLDDSEARYQAAAAQLDLAQAQYAQAQARLDELKINLSNTVITSPVNGFVGSRTLDPGAWVTPNSVFLSLVDIGVVRIVSNVVERDLRRISLGRVAEVEVDAYPGETFTGRVTRIAPVLDPLTRTAQIEIEINNAAFRLKPGMYARVSFTVDERDQALVVPATAIVELGGKRGVFLPSEKNVATFQPVTVGLMEQTLVEIAEGLEEGQRIVTTGAAALREGDPIIIAGQGAGQGGRGGQRAADGGTGRGRGAAPGTAPAAEGAPAGAGQGAPAGAPAAATRTPNVGS
jgi:RND family efflux transporter MFP subunit